MSILVVAMIVLVFGGAMSRLAKKYFYINDHLELFEMGHVTDRSGLLVAQLLLLPDGFIVRLLAMALLGVVVSASGGAVSQAALAVGVLAYLVSAGMRYQYNAGSSGVKGAAFREMMKTHDSSAALRFRDSMPSSRLASWAEILSGVSIAISLTVAALLAVKG